MDSLHFTQTAWAPGPGPRPLTSSPTILRSGKRTLMGDTSRRPARISTRVLQADGGERNDTAGCSPGGGMMVAGMPAPLSCQPGSLVGGRRPDVTHLAGTHNRGADAARLASDRAFYALSVQRIPRANDFSRISPTTTKTPGVQRRRKKLHDGGGEAAWAARRCLPRATSGAAPPPPPVRRAIVDSPS